MAPVDSADMSIPTASPGPIWVRKTVVPRPAPDPTLRASTADRQHYADLLGWAYATGQLDDAEFSARVETALGATYLGDFAPLIRDLNLAALPAASHQEGPATASLALRKQATPPAHLPRRSLKVVGSIVAAGAIALAGYSIGANSQGYYDPYSYPMAPPGIQYYPYAYQPYTYAGPASMLPETLTVDMGPIVVDLTGITVDTPRHFAITVDWGDTAVILPTDGRVQVVYTVLNGAAVFEAWGNNAQSQGGTSAAGTFNRLAGAPGSPTLVIEVTLNAGTLTVSD